MATVAAGEALEPRAASDVVPEVLRTAALTVKAARREILARHVALAGPVSVDDVLARYDFDARWVQRRLEDWERHDVLVRGVFGGARDVPRWASRRLLEQARRRELARARQQIEAVGIDRFARFLQRWQHLAPDTQLEGSAGAAAVMSQLYGVARPAEGWERDYLPARLERYDTTRWCASPPRARSFGRWNPDRAEERRSGGAHSEGPILRARNGTPLARSAGRRFAAERQCACGTRGAARGRRVVHGGRLRRDWARHPADTGRAT